jgi:hypothetical protein
MMIIIIVSKYIYKYKLFSLPHYQDKGLVYQSSFQVDRAHLTTVGLCKPI